MSSGVSVQTGRQNLRDEVAGHGLGEGLREAVTEEKQNQSCFTHPEARMASRCLFSSVCLCAAQDGVLGVESRALGMLNKNSPLSYSPGCK